MPPRSVEAKPAVPVAIHPEGGTAMRKRLPVLLAFSIILSASIGVVGAQADTSAKFDYHIADSFIEAGTGIDQTGARARADNRDTVSVVGSGTFNTASLTASGGGTFEHRDRRGRLVGEGTWTATGVKSFEFYGCGGGGFPANFCGGLLVLDVHLVGAGGTLAFDGVLTVDCLIGANVPAGAEEGITLDIPGLIDFDDLIEEESGLTLFVSRSKS
jgi:hypothetical protein